MVSPGTGKKLNAQQRIDEVMDFWKANDNGNWQVLRKRLIKAVRAAVSHTKEEITKDEGWYKISTEAGA